MKTRFESYELPVPRYPRVLAWALRLLQRRCRHYGLKADVLEGSCYPHWLRWCETCGAIWPTIAGTPCGSPRMPEPTWEAPRMSKADVDAWRGRMQAEARDRLAARRDAVSPLDCTPEGG